MVWVYGDWRVFDIWCMQRGWSTRDRGIRHIPRRMDQVHGFMPRPGDLVIELDFTTDHSQAADHADREWFFRKQRFPGSVAVRVDRT